LNWLSYPVNIAADNSCNTPHHLHFIHRGSLLTDSLSPNSAIMADRYIPEHRRTTFKAKNTFKPDELRRRREEQQVEIRKQKREENLAKRRGISGRGESAPGAALGAAPDSDDESITIESQVRQHLQVLSEHCGPKAEGEQSIGVLHLSSLID